MDLWPWALAALLCVAASARLTRLLTQDMYPPAMWLRDRWDARTEESDWNLLLHCHWCLAPWVALPLVVASYFALADHRSDFHPWHLLWGFMAWMAVSYLASWIVNNDEGLVIVRESN